MRDTGGKFVKGQSGNPSGRPKVVGELRDLAREHTEDAVKTLVKICNDEDAPSAARTAAAVALLDRGHGRPSQNIEAKIDVYDAGRAHAQALMELANRAKEAKALEAKKAEAIAVEYMDVTPATKN